MEDFSNDIEHLRIHKINQEQSIKDKEIKLKEFGSMLAHFEEEQETMKAKLIELSERVNVLIFLNLRVTSSGYHLLSVWFTDRSLSRRHYA